MSNNISANTLFHFTKSIDSIIGILTNDFSPRFCMENQNFMFGFANSKTKYAIPMVCFCDIPLSEIKSHIKNYGSYSIGLSKDWGKKNGINPVMYAIENSISIKMLNNSMEALYNNVIKDEELLAVDSLSNVKENAKKSFKGIFDFTCFLKQYEGKRWNGRDFEGDVVRFYDEREWRFVPDLRNMNNIEDIVNGGLKAMTLSKQEYLNETIRNKCNNLMGKYAKLKFTPNDINYIIVQSDDEVLEIEEKIKKIKGSKYTYDELRKLTTKILCADRVLEDF